jgi:hypothetical protein
VRSDVNTICGTRYDPGEKQGYFSFARRAGESGGISRGFFVAADTSVLLLTLVYSVKVPEKRVPELKRKQSILETIWR